MEDLFVFTDVDVEVQSVDANLLLKEPDSTSSVFSQLSRKNRKLKKLVKREAQQ